MSTTLTEVLPATRSNPHAAIRWTPGEFQGCGTLEIQNTRSVCRYILTELPTGWDGRAFKLLKPLGESGTDISEDAYHVFCGRNGQDRQCDCKGFSRHGHCKHVEAARALIANGWV
jgi:hypothetical protein